MSPTLMPGDYVIATRRTSPPRRGEVIVFELDEQPGFHLVKRVVGLPGETIRIESGRVEIDGRALDEPWSALTTGGQGSWVLGPTEIFVLGDSRHASDSDSRQVGPIMASPRNVVTWRYWPKPRRITPWRNP